MELWLACYSLEEIAEREHLTKQAVSLICQELADLPKLDKSTRAVAEHAVATVCVWAKRLNFLGAAKIFLGLTISNWCAGAPICHGLITRKWRRWNRTN